MPKYVYFSFLRREFFISESKSKGVLAKLWIEVSGDWTAFWYKYITCYLKTKQRHPAVLWSSLSLTARQQKSLCFLDSANLEDISWKELSKCPATPPDSQVEGFVARIQNLRGSDVGQATVVYLLGVDCFVMWQTPTNPLWKCSRACSNSVRWKSASAFVRVIPIWSARNLGGDLINYSLAAIQQGIPSLIWFGLQRGEYLTATNLILVIHKRIPQHNLSILQRPCPKGKPAVASAESMSNEKWTYLWAS